MKKIILSLVFILPMLANAQSTVVDDFESYTLGSFDGQFNPTQWVGWGGGPSNATVSSDYAYSGTKSIKVWDNPTTVTETDLVALLGTLFQGIDTVTFQQYIASAGSGAYYNLQHNYTNTAGDWAAEVYFGTSPSAAYMQTDGVQYNFTPVFDAWVEQMFIFDHANNTAYFYYNGTLTHTWALNTNAAGGVGLKTINAINFYAHDNATGANSLAYYDDIPVYSPPAYNVAITDIAQPASYTHLTTKHLMPLNLSADVANIGGLGVTNVAVTFEVQDGGGTTVFTETVSQATLATGATATFTPTGTYVPSATGSYTINYDLTITETDDDLSDNIGSFAYTLTVTDSTLAKDDGIAIASIGVSGAGPGQMGHIYELMTADSISSVGVSFVQTNPVAIGESILVHIYNTTNGIPTGAPIATSAALLVDTSSNLVEKIYAFASPVALSAGAYFIAVEEGLSTAAIAYTVDIFTPYTGYFSTDGGGSWTAFDDVGFPITLFVRPNVTGIINVSTQNVQAFEGVFEIMPNPTAGQAWINVEMEDAQDIHVAIYDMTGKLVQGFTDAHVANQRYGIDLSNATNGVYLVRMTTNGQTITKKLVLNR